MNLQLIAWLRSLSIIAAAYLLGSIPTGYLLMRFVRKQDIRSLGSGNIGATNVLRSGDKSLAIATFLIDVLKGALAVLLGARLAAIGFPPIPAANAMALAALCAVLGHMHPIWLNLRGGKGVATAFGVFLVLSPWAALVSLGIFISVVAFSRYVSLGSILAAAAFPVAAWYLSTAARSWVAYTVMWLVAVLIIVKHHANIQRLMSGTEYRFGSRKSPAARSASQPSPGPETSLGPENRA
jgi:glycerol-3-phosphate acyltransferase PlsY